MVLSVPSGETTIAQAARKEQVSEQSIGRWKAEFLEAGNTALAAGRSGPSTREEQLAAQVEDLTQALGLGSTTPSTDRWTRRPLGPRKQIGRRIFSPPCRSGSHHPVCGTRGNLVRQKPQRRTS